MDLSAVIFVVLALAWAVYLIPKALQHHDEMASGRLVEGHSERVRILRRKQVRVEETVAAPEVETEPAPVATKRRSRRTTTARPADTRPVTRPATTRAAARRAAQRRRRVLGVLVLALAVVGGLAAFAVVPMWAPAVPGAMVLLFLVVARLSVRTAQRASLAQRRPVRVAEEPSVETVVEEARPVRRERTAAELVDVLADEDVAEAPREEIEAVLADDGSLWDPLPMTLPTYVNKARARRTVRTIELTNVASSGHSEADSTLAREAEASQAAADADAAEAAQRKAAGA